MPAAVGALIPALAPFAATAVGSFIINTALSVGLSLITQMLTKKEMPNAGGISIDRPTVGDTTGQNIVLGYYATPGNYTAPPYTQGHSGDTPNAFLTSVIDICDVPIKGFKNVIWVGEDRVELDPTPTSGGLYPGSLQPVEGSKYRGYLWVRFYNGSQTTADPHMLNTGTNGPRPWNSNMIGRSVAYAVVHMKYETEVFSGETDLLFEVEGALLYDPRKDSTVSGGNGPHRYGQLNTYEYTENPVVMIYNIYRGIVLPDGNYWGGRSKADELPTSTWFAAMNKCDIPRAEDGKPTFRAAYNINIGPEEFDGHEPASVIEELLAACLGTVAEIQGGVWGIRIGAPDLPVAFLTDDDIIVTENESFDPFPSIDATVNGAQTQYPEPAERWASKQAPIYYATNYEVEDRGRRNLANIPLSAVTDLLQVQMIQKAAVEDARRFKRHEITLPPDYAHITPLDSIGWTSERFGYINDKPFEVASKGENLKSLNCRFSIRERDSGDFVWNVSDKLPSVVNPHEKTEVPVQYGVPGENWSPFIITDEAGNPRRAGVALTWDMDGQGDVVGVSWQVRPQGGTALVNTGTTQAVREGRQVITEGLVSSGFYEGRAKVQAYGRRTDWGPWSFFTTHDVRLSFDDLADEIVQDFEQLITDLGNLEDEVEQNRIDINEAVQQTGQLIGQATQRLDAVEQGLTDQGVAIRGELDDAVIALQGDITDATNNLRLEIEPAVEAGLVEYDTSVQGQFDAMAGQISQLTAMLASLELIQNGDFSDGLNNWTTNAYVYVHTRGVNEWGTVNATAPADNIVRLQPTGSFSQVTSEFAVGGGELFNTRFAAYALAVNAGYRDIILGVRWFDALGAEILPASEEIIALPQNVWTAYSIEFDPPDNAVTAEVSFSRVQPSGNNVFFTNIKSNTINKSVEAEITDLQVATTNLSGAFTAFKNEMTARMGSAETNITTEIGARADADIALGGRIDTVETNLGLTNAAVSDNATAISEAEQAMAAMESEIVARFGITQLVRDADFSKDTDYWTIPAPANIVLRDKNSTNWWLKEMPGAKAYGFLGNQNTGQYLSTELVDGIQPGDVLDVGFWAGKTHTGSPTPEVSIQFITSGNPTPTEVKFTPPPEGMTVGSYSEYSILGVIVPKDVVQTFLRVHRLGGSGSSGQRTYVTGFSVKKRSVFDSVSQAQIAELYLAFADSEAALAQYKIDLNTRFEDNEADIADEILARADADDAMAQLITDVTTRVGNNETTLTQHSQAITNAVESIGLVETGIIAQFGNRQLVRDPEFAQGMEYWSQGPLNGQIVNRDINSSSALLRNMPAKASWRNQWNPAGNRYSEIFDISVDEIYDLSFYVGRESGGPSYTVFVEWRDDKALNSNIIAVSSSGNSVAPPETWQFFNVAGLIPPVGAVAARVGFMKSGAGANANWGYVTKITLTARGGFERETAARIDTAQIAIADVDDALTQYIISNNSRVGLAEGAISSEVTTRAQADTALSGRIDTLSGTVEDNEAAIEAHSIAIADNDEAIASVYEELTSTFGKSQLVRDPDFSNGITYWFGAMGDASRIIPRNVNWGSWQHNEMPGDYGFTILTNDSGGRTSPFFEASEKERYDFGAFVGIAGDGAPGVTFGIQWFDKNGTQIGNESTTVPTGNKSYEFYGKQGVKPPAGTAQGRAYFVRGPNGSSTDPAQRAIITAFEVNRQSIGGFISQATVEQTSQTVADLNQAFSDFSVETNASFGRITAGGRLRVYSVAAMSGGISRVALTAEAAGASNATAGLFLEAKSDGSSAVYIDANRLALVSGPASNAQRTTPFFVENGVVYMTKAIIKEATIGTLHLEGGAIVTGVSVSINISQGSRNIVVPTYNNQSRFIVLASGKINPVGTGVGLGGSVRANYNGKAKVLGRTEWETYTYGDNEVGTRPVSDDVYGTAVFDAAGGGNQTINISTVANFVGDITILEVRKSR